MSDPTNNQGPPTHADHRALFAAHGLRCTRQRQVVYAALAGTREHPTAEAIYDAVKATPEAGDGTISLATVYNTLETLTQRGLCRKLATPGGPTRFDAITDEHAHVQAPDGSLVDLPDDLSRRVMAGVRDPALIDEIEQRLGVKVGRISIHLAAE
ncbi:MAG: transcriptional repressor [Phycisphaera sp.]|nr:MAG: transcriptional repressor [Phycisphaera sp.]